MAAVFDFIELRKALRRLTGHVFNAQGEERAEEQDLSQPASQPVCGTKSSDNGNTNNPGYHDDTGLRDNWE